MTRFRGVWFAVVIAGALTVAACTKDPAKASREYLDSGNRLFAEAKYREAVVEYRNAVQQDPQSGEARQKLSEAYEKLGDVQNAYREVIRAADLLPGDVAAQLRAANYLIATGQFEDAKARADRASAIDPKNVEAVVVRGRALAGLKDLDGAAEEIQEAIALAPKESSTYDKLGGLEMAKGNQAEAEAAFKKALEVNPQSIEAHLTLGIFYWYSDRRADAEAEFKAALAIDPKSVSVHRTLATFYMSLRRVNDAETHLKWLAENSPSVEPKLQLVDFYLLNNRKADALKSLEPLASRKEAFAEARSRMATLRYDEGDKAGGHQIIEEVLRQEPQNLKALMVKAGFLVIEQKTDEAMTQVKAALVVAPQSAVVHFAMGGLYAQKRDVDSALKEYREVLRLNPRASAAQLQIARLELARGGTNTSVQAAESAVKLAPASPDAQLVLANSLLAKGDVVRAEPIVRALSAKYPNSAAIETQRGHVLNMKKDPAGARRAYEHALQLQPTSVEALTGIVTLDMTEHKYDQARARIDAQLAHAPKNPALLVLAARTYFQAGQPQRSEEFLRRAIDADPSNIEAYGLLASYYVSNHQADSAIAQYNEILKRNPRSVPALTAIGMLLESQNKTAEAQKRYEQAVQIDPGAAVASNNLAWIYASTGGDLNVALKLAQAAKQAQTDNPQINDTLGWVYFKKGLPTLAVEPFKASAEKDPSNPVYPYHLGLAYLAGGDNTNARAAFERALAIAPSFDGAADARQKLQTLKGQ